MLILAGVLFLAVLIIRLALGAKRVAREIQEILDDH